MLQDLNLLLGWIMLFAALLLAHLANLWMALRSDELPWTWRLFALIPVFTPWVAWAGGHRTGPVLWMVCCTLYMALRFQQVP